VATFTFLQSQFLWTRKHVLTGKPHRNLRAVRYALVRLEKIRLPNGIGPFANRHIILNIILQLMQKSKSHYM